MAEAFEPAQLTAGGITFALERFERTDDGRVEIDGHWSGVRGRRFIRPSLTVGIDGSAQRFLAELDDKPWAADDGELWKVAFTVPDLGPAELAEAELAVAPDILLRLPAPAGARRRRRVTPRRQGETAKAPPRRTKPRGVTAERDALRSERAALRSERDELRLHLERAGAALSEAEAARERSESERDTAIAARDAALATRDTALAARDTALAERNDAIAARDTALAERNAAIAARDSALTARDAAIARTAADPGPARPLIPPPAVPTDLPPAVAAGLPAVQPNVGWLRRGLAIGALVLLALVVALLAHLV